MEENITYTDAFNQLQIIVAEIESGKISVDELAVKVKKATELISICRKKLYSTEEDVNKILEDLK